MVIAQSKITAQGQISVPAEVRRRLGVGPGSILEWDEESGQVVVRRADAFTFEDIHRAVFRDRPKVKKLAVAKAGIREEMKRRHGRR